MNLIMNGADAMGAVTDRPRVLQHRIEGRRRRQHAGQRSGIRELGSRKPSGIAFLIRLFTTKPTGMGMGLSICRSIIEAHSGKLWATPATPNGTDFRFTIPTVASGGRTDDRLM